MYISDPTDTNLQLNTTEEYLTFSIPSHIIRLTSLPKIYDPQSSSTVRYIQLGFSGAAPISLYQGLLRSIRFEFIWLIISSSLFNIQSNYYTIYPKRPKVFQQPKLQFIRQTLAKARDDIQRCNLCVCLNQNSRIKK